MKKQSKLYAFLDDSRSGALPSSTTMPRPALTEKDAIKTRIRSRVDTQRRVGSWPQPVATNDPEAVRQSSGPKIARDCWRKQASLTKSHFGLSSRNFLRKNFSSNVTNVNVKRLSLGSPKALSARKVTIGPGSLALSYTNKKSFSFSCESWPTGLQFPIGVRTADKTLCVLLVLSR